MNSSSKAGIVFFIIIISCLSVYLFINYSSSYLTSVDWSIITGKPTEFNPILHYHNTTEIYGIFNITHNNITDWSTATSGFLTSIPTLSLTHNNISDWSTYINQALLTSSTVKFNSVNTTVNDYDQSGFNLFYDNNVYPMMSIYVDGLAFGDGNNTFDTTLYRNGANMLNTPDNFRIVGGGQSPITSYNGIYVNPDSESSQISVENNAGIEGCFIAHSTAGIIIGSMSNSELHIRTNNNDGLLIDTSQVLWIGSTKDTNLYRSGANILKTDDNLEIPYGYLLVSQITTSGSIAQITVTDRDLTHNGFIFYTNNDVMRIFPNSVGTDKYTFDIYGGFTAYNTIRALGNFVSADGTVGYSGSFNDGTHTITVKNGLITSVV